MGVLGNLDPGRKEQEPPSDALCLPSPAQPCCSPCCQLRHLLPGLGHWEKGPPSLRLGLGLLCGGGAVTLPLSPSRSQPLRNGCTPRGSGEAGLTGRALGGDHCALDTSPRVGPGQVEVGGFPSQVREVELWAPREGGWLSPQVHKTALPPSSQWLHPGLAGHF